MIQTQYAVIWTDGGFSKFDVATLQVVQRVYKTPPSSQENNDDLAEEITLVNSCSDRQRKLGNMQLSQMIYRKDAPVDMNDTEDITTLLEEIDEEETEIE